MTVLDIADAGLSGEVRGQEAVNQSGEGAQVPRFRHERLQIALGREDPVEFGKAQNAVTYSGGETCRLS